MSFQYEHAPITEALIDIRIEPASVTLQAIEALRSQVSDLYPRREKRALFTGEFIAGDAVGATAKRVDAGFAFISGDGRQVFQARFDGFTFSRLRPYVNWPQLRDEAKRLWTIYREVANPPRISRVAVRYINQINIPSAKVDYKEYFLTAPEVSPSLPQGLSNFFMQLEFPQPDFEGMLVLRQGAAPPPVPDTVSVILDLDVFKQMEHESTENEIWNLLEVLRNRKNEFFEGSLTDKARHLFGDRREY